MRPKLTLILAFTLLCTLPLLKSHAQAQRDGVHIEQLAREGRQFTPEQVADAEKSLEAKPDDIDQRIRLLGHYFTQRLRVRQVAADSSKHVLWIIKNQPTHPAAASVYVRADKILQSDTYEKAKALWLEHLKAKPNDVDILSNAGGFFMLHDRNLALELMNKACELKPDDVELAEQLGNAYLLDATLGKDAVENAKRALKPLERALEKSDAMKRFYLLTSVARAALMAEEFEKAGKYAKELLDTAVELGEKDWNFGNAVHHGNLILGHIALKRDDVEAAERHLIKAGKTPGSPQLNSFGPNMALAKALLEKGRKEVVIEYLTLCGKFWRANETSAWIKTIENGKTPNFGANLLY